MYTRNTRGHKTCTDCGATLDPQESCDCKETTDFEIPDCTVIVHGAIYTPAELPKY